VGCVCRNEAEICSRTHQRINPTRNVVSQIVGPAGVEHGDALINVEVVDENVWIA
jgi:hypothetical protein